MYVMGIDVGTTFTAAAVLREGQAEICRLGTRSATIPSVVLLRESGEVLVGEAADRRAVTEPERVAREFKRRFGDSTPLVLGGTPLSAEALTAHVISAVVADVTRRQGAAPAAVCLSHPANWGTFKTDLLRQTVRLADLDVPVLFVTEPEAAAIDYAREQRLDVGDTIAVYDLGGGTFDAAVLRRTDDGFVILGTPEGIDRLGGMDIDAAVFDHVARSLDGLLADLDEEDPGAVAAMARLRRECTEAKEALSDDTDTAIPVLLPGMATTVRLTRGELETMVRPALQASIGALRRALRSASVEPAELSAVLLVGGSSRIPLVARMIGAELGRPVAVDAEPKHAVALGAAMLAGGATTLRDDAPPAQRPTPSPARPTIARQTRRRAGQAVVTVAFVGLVTAGGILALRPDDVRTVATQQTTTLDTSSASAPDGVPADRIPADRMPAPVGSLTVSSDRTTGSTATSLLVSWLASPGATSYLVEWWVTGISDSGNGDSGNGNSGKSDSGNSRTSAASPVTINGLLPGTRYSVRVTPTNARGSGPSTTATGATAR